MKQLLKSVARKLMRPMLFSAEFDASVQRAVRPILAGTEFDASVRQAVRPVVDGSVTNVLRSDEVKYLLGDLVLDKVARWIDPLSVGSRVDKGTQILLSLKYKELVRNQQPLPAFDDVGFRSFSQFDEDGILLYIFSLIGIATRTAVEICAGIGYESNAANWIIHHGFHGLLFDGNKDNVELMGKFFSSRFDTYHTPPICAHAWLESDTVDDQIRRHGFTGEIDLLTIDMDGIDYWILNAIRCVQPRVIVVEYHSGWLADEPRTIPDLKSFQYSSDKPAFCSASLAAFHKLLGTRGYRLVGCNRNRLNAFFVRNGLGDDILPAVSVASCLEHPKLTWFRNTYRPHLLQQTDWVRC